MTDDEQSQEEWRATPSGAGAGLVQAGPSVRAVLRGPCPAEELRKLPVADGEAKQDALHPFF